MNRVKFDLLFNNLNFRMNDKMTRNISKNAVEVLKKFPFKYRLLLDCEETVCSDGHDDFGPESYLYDFFIIYKTQNSIFVDKWHREIWFDQVSSEYELTGTKSYPSLV
jgi:hypothetical protein